MTLRPFRLLQLTVLVSSLSVVQAEPAKQATSSSPVKQQSPDQAQTQDSAAATSPSMSALDVNTESQAFKSLVQLDELTQIGMPGLALRMIEQQQSLYKRFSSDWYTYEFKRIKTLAALDQWDAVAERSTVVLKQAGASGQITPRIESWFRAQLAIAQLNLGQPEQTLDQCRQLLWRETRADDSFIAVCRRLIIQAYLRMDKVDDARKSLLKYRRDYGEYKGEWRQLQARALLRADRPAEVIDLLADDESHDAKILSMVATVRSRPKKIKATIKDVKRELADKDILQSQRRDYQYVLYEAHLRNKDLVSAALAAEQLLALSRVNSTLKDDFQLDGDDLWNLYTEIGVGLGNKYKLLVGDDTAWYKRAAEIEKKSPVQARSLYAVIAFNSPIKKKSQLAHKEIANLLAVNDDGLEVINQLYLQSERAGSPQDLSADVRYRLVDHALSNGDITLAATMMASLPQPPDGEDLFNWQIRKARVLILEGRHEEGEKVLEASLQNQKTLEREQIDRYLQVVFDLQTVSRHEQALELFDLLPEADMDDKLKRELYYWKAESNYEIERYGHAAVMYFKSARTGDPDMIDLWAQSARFKAADALVKAALYEDAKHAYTELMRITANDARKRVIRQKLQQIQLLRNSAEEQDTHIEQAKTG
jgi:hypothetical protein